MVVALIILHSGLSTTAALARYYQRCHHHFCVVISFFLSFPILAQVLIFDFPGEGGRGD